MAGWDGEGPEPDVKGAALPLAALVLLSFPVIPVSINGKVMSQTTLQQRHTHAHTHRGPEEMSPAVLPGLSYPSFTKSTDTYHIPLSTGSSTSLSLVHLHHSLGPKTQSLYCCSQ